MLSIYSWKIAGGTVELHPHSETACRAVLHRDNRHYSIPHQDTVGIPAEWVRSGHLAEILSHTHIKISPLGEGYQVEVLGSLNGGGAGPSKDARSASVEEKDTANTANTHTPSSNDKEEFISPHQTYISPKSQESDNTGSKTVDLAKQTAESLIDQAGDAIYSKPFEAALGETWGGFAFRLLQFETLTTEDINPSDLLNQKKEEWKDLPERDQQQKLDEWYEQQEKWSRWREQPSTEVEAQKQSNESAEKPEQEKEKASSSSSYDSRYSSDSASDRQLDQKDDWCSSSDYSDSSSSSYLENGYRSSDGRDNSGCFGRDWQEGNARDAQAERIL